MRVLHFDCFSGASGDMIMGALIDAGVALDDVRRALGSVAVDTEAVWTERVVRAGITATRFCVRGESAPGTEPVHAGADALEPVHAHAHGEHGAHSHGHSHGHEHAAAPSHGHVHDAGALAHGHAHPHRTLSEIYAIIDRAALSAAGRERAKALFARLGEAEAAIHGTPLDRVHLHEVGALDSIIDIVGAVFALESLGIDRITASPLNVGGGMIRSAHGVYPVPAPATVRLLGDAPIYSGPVQAELLTPTGALLITSYASSFGSVPPMRVQRVGYGAGTRDFHETPNVLRVLIGETDSAASRHSVVVIEAEIDDMNPQIFGTVMDQLLAQGALDVFYTPIQMKKNRPGTLMTIIATPESRDRLTTTVFRETTTIGVRFRDMIRECLDREVITVATAYGAVRVKLARRSGELLNAAPEFEDCARLAADQRVPLKDVHAAAIRAYLDMKR